jgi:hypothetical protein
MSVRPNVNFSEFTLNCRKDVRRFGLTHLLANAVITGTAAITRTIIYCAVRFCWDSAAGDAALERCS